MCRISSPISTTNTSWLDRSVLWSFAPLLSPLIVIFSSYSLSKSGTSSCVKRERWQRSLLWGQKYRNHTVASLPGCITWTWADRHTLRMLPESTTRGFDTCAVALQLWSAPLPRYVAAAQHGSFVCWIYVNFWTVTADLARPFACVAFPKTACSIGNGPGFAANTQNCTSWLVSAKIQNIMPIQNRKDVILQ